MSAPTQIDDGPYRYPGIVGEPQIEFPYANEGDLSAFVYHVKYRQDFRYFTALEPMSVFSTPLGDGYLVEPENTDAIGNGLVEWTRVVASIPQTRVVPVGSVTLNMQYLVTTVGVGYSVEEFPVTRSGTATYEYGLAAFPIQQSPRWFTYLNGTKLAAVGGAGRFAAGDMVLVQDSETTLYMGLIYQRKTIRCPFGVDFEAP